MGLGVEERRVGGGHILITTFMKRIQFCILTGNEKQNPIPDTRTDCIHLSIIYNQCCVLVILMQEIFPKGKGNYSQTCVKQVPWGKPKSGCLRQVLDNTGKCTLIFLLWDLKKWPLKTGDCLIQVTFRTGLTVNVITIVSNTVLIYEFWSGVNRTELAPCNYKPEA